MPYSGRQLVIAVSIIYLVLVTALGAYASSDATKFSLPIPNGLAYATTLLPFVSGLIEAGCDLARLQERRKHPNRGDKQHRPLVIILNTLIFIYSTSVITQLGTHVAPSSGLVCGLRDRWETLYRRKDAETVRTIQDAFKCCGFRSSRDMAWPFPDKTHKATACEEAFGHTNGCLEPWKGKEQAVAGILMTVVALVTIWQLIIIVIPSRHEPWLHSVVPESVSRIVGEDDDDDEDGNRRAIDYLPNFNRYSDRVQEDEGNGDEENGVRKAIKSGTEQVENVVSGRSDDAEQERGPLENEWLRSTN